MFWHFGTSVTFVTFVTSYKPASRHTPLNHLSLL